MDLVIERSGTLFGASWLALGRFWVVLGSSWAALSKLLGPTWPLLGTSWLVWAATWKDFGPRTPPGLHFKGFWRVPGLRFPMVFAAPCALLPNAFFDAVTIIFAFTVTIFLFFRCGGLCAAHGI